MCRPAPAARPGRPRRMLQCGAMRFAILGSGAVGGYYGAKLARAGRDVTLIARGAHLAAIRERGLEVRSPLLGDFVVRPSAEEDSSRIGVVDVVIVAVKAYDNDTALPLIAPMLGPSTAILTLQNGVDSVTEIAERYGPAPVIGGTTYVAAALAAPGVIEQTGSHRRIVMGEVFGDPPQLSDRVRAIGDALASADIQVETVADARVPIWEKFILLATMAAFTGAARLPVGPLWADGDIRARILDGCREIERVAHAEGIAVAPDMIDRIRGYIANLPPTMRSSMLIDLSLGKRIEVEALQGAVVRRAARAGVPVPVISTLYAVLKPWAHPAG